jgi:sugar/nucleoside kinase (ribokinase family)
VITVDGSTTTFAAPLVKAVDSTGAGDCFAGAFAAARLRGFDPFESAGFACVAAALSCLGFGATAALPSFDEVLRHQRSISPLQESSKR